MKHTIQDELRGVLIFVGVVWAVFLLDVALPSDLTNWGIFPRRLTGLIGIPLAPFLHGSWGHIIGNTVPLLVLLTLLAGSRVRSWPTVAEIVLLGGALLWIFGRSSVHVGASGLIYGLIVFLILSGFREQRLAPMMIALLVGFLYGTTLLWGILPIGDPHVSWEGHLTSALAGGIIGYISTRQNPDSNEPMP